MMKNIYFLFLIITQTCICQSPSIQWESAFGEAGDDKANSIQQTSDGGYIIAGYTISNYGPIDNGNHGALDYLLLKLSFSGNIQWQKKIGGSGSDTAYSIQQTTDGGYIVAGSSYSNDGDIIGNHGGSDAWVIKIDLNGDIQWQNSLGGTSNDVAYSIYNTSDGGYIVAGYTTSNDGDVTANNGGSDAWVVKLSNIGTIQWQKTLGGINDEIIYNVQQTTDGGYIVAGSTASNDGDVAGNKGGDDYWVVKLSGLGAIEWQKTLGGTNNEEAFCIQQVLDGGYIIAGTTTSNDGDITGNHGNADYWIVKLSATGVLQWQKTLGGTNGDSATSIQQTADGGYIVAGNSYSNDGDLNVNHGYNDYWIVKLSDLGAIQWQKAFGGSSNDIASCIKQTTDSGYIIAGSVSGSSTSNNGDITGMHGLLSDTWIVKLAPDVMAISSLTKNTFRLYPNPAINILTLESAYNLVFDKIIITDLTGKIVLEQTQNTNQINVENLDKGIYIIQAFSSDKKFTNKFIKEE